VAKYGSDQVGFFLVDGYDILGTVTEFNDEREALIEEVTALGDSWQAQAFTGVRRAELSQQGYFDDAANSAHAALEGNEGTARILTYGVEGNEAGKRFTGYEGAMQVNYERVVTRGELHKANARYLGSGAVDVGRILRAQAVVTASGNTTGDSYDSSASSTNGGVGYLQLPVLDVTGASALSVRILDSADDLTFAELVAFTNTSAAPDAERKAVTGSVDRYLAVDWNGTSASAFPASAEFMVGFARA